MPVTFNVAKHAAEPVQPRYEPLQGAEDLLKVTWGSRGENQCKELLQSTFSGADTEFTKIVPERNGFVRSVITAYNQHHHLVLRPDDVWIAILGQFNFYVNAHAEELRSQFVAHEGQKTLEVTAVGSRYTVDFGNLAKQMTGLIHENVVDKDLKDWILPDFSTTTHNDTVVSSVLMMATLKAYFEYKMSLMCGLPSVTLEGEREDWVKLLNRLDKFNSFGAQPTAWAALLRPILTRFVSSFDGNPDLDFWSKICHYTSGGSGPSYISGWITAFTVWSSEGAWIGPPLGGAAPTFPRRVLELELDGARFSYLDTGDIPSGYCEVDVLLDDNGEKFKCLMVSGHMGRQTVGSKSDTVKLLPAWFMFIK